MHYDELRDPNYVTKEDVLDCHAFLEDEVGQFLIKLAVETSDPLQEVLDDLVRDSGELTSGTEY